MLVIGVTGYSVMRHDGYIARVVDDDEKKVTEHIDSVIKIGKERHKHRFPELKYSWGSLEKEEGLNNIALIGDSHAGALLPGLMMNERENDGIAAFTAGCGIPFMGIQAGSKKEWQARFYDNEVNYLTIGKGFDYVLAHPEIRKVILAHFPGCFMFGGIRSLDNQPFSSQEQILSDGISRTFKVLSEAGKEVVYVLDVPTFSKDGFDVSKVKACAAGMDFLHSPLPLRSALNQKKGKVSIDEVCAMPEDESGTASGHALLEKLAKKEAGKYRNIHIVDLTKLLCQDKTCRMTRDGRMLYSDSQHINMAGAAAAAPLVLKGFGD